MKSYRHLFLLALVICLSACNKCSGDKQEQEKVVLVDKPELINEEVNKLLFEKLSDFDTSKTLVLEKDSLLSTPLLLLFYKENKYSLSWTDKGNLRKEADSLVSILQNADKVGLIANDYHYSNIEGLLKTVKDTGSKKFDATKLMNLDLFLTDALFKFSVHISKGRLNADSLIVDWPGRLNAFLGMLQKDSVKLEGQPEQPNHTFVRMVLEATKTNTIQSLLDSIEPHNVYYQNLKIALKNYKFEFKGIEWDSLASRESDSTTFKERLKARLIASHDYFEEFSGNDSIKLLKSIKNFQCKHNLVEDGKIGKLTFKALQQTKEDVIRQIEMNLERWRWYTPPTDKQYVWVNIPKFEMKVIEKDTLVMKSRVITGAPDHQTPLLKSTIRYFLIYPYWTVPFSIATKEILPILKRDTSYLRRKNFDVLDGNNKKVDASKINWKRYSKTYFPWRLRQGIGEDNSLGILKFNFENKYGVYMHDTDNHRLFGREMRALSHGCCRLEKFMDFAQFLIRDDSVKYPVDSFKVDLLKEQQKYVYIRHPIPIYINYFTAEVDEYMELHFFNDVYRRDEKMLKNLYEK